MKNNQYFFYYTCLHFILHPHIEIAINPICSGQHYPFHFFGWRAPEHVLFFLHIAFWFSRKLCILGCFSQLGDGGKKSGAPGRIVTILTSPPTIPESPAAAQYTGSIHPSTTATNPTRDVGPLAVSCQLQAGCQAAHTRGSNRNPCLSGGTEGDTFSTAPPQCSDCQQVRALCC